jgi:excisionase family DNA binding protein
MDERLAYSPDEAAKASGQGRTKVFQDIKTGKLRAVKNGRRTLILRPDLEEYLRSMPPRAACLVWTIIVTGIAALWSFATLFLAVV